MIVVDLDQGTPPWLAFRKNKITASDCPVIMGQSPFKTPRCLWMEKLGLYPEPLINSKMRRGMELENEARWVAQTILDCELSPKVIQSSTIDFLIASLDGIAPNGEIAVEIKCMGKKNHSKAMKGGVPEYYIGQLQHQMYVTELDKIYLFAYDTDCHNMIEVFRDNSFIEKMLVKEREFYECMQNLIWNSAINAA